MMPSSGKSGSSSKLLKVATVLAVVALVVSVGTSAYLLANWPEETERIIEQVPTDTGGDDDDDGEQTQTDSDGDGVLDTNDEWPGYDDEKFSDKKVVVAMVQEPKDLNPIRMTDLYSSIVMMSICEPLIRTNPNGQPNCDGKAIASSYEVSDDGLTYTFQIDEGITFHNGEKCTAEDVVFTLNTLRNKEEPLSPRQQDFAAMKSVEKTGEHEVTITLKSVDTAFTTVTLPNAYIVPKDYIEENGWDQWDKEKIGTGPYQFEEYVTGDHILLKRFEDYRNKPAYIKKLEYRIYPERSSAVMAMRTGDAHYQRAIPADQWESLKPVQKVLTRSYSSLSFEFLQFNVTQEPFDNAKVRKALAYSIDTSDVIAAERSNELTNNDRSPLPPDFPGHADVNQYERNVDKAKQLLSEAGYDSIDTKLYCVPGPRAQAAQVIAKQASDAGFNIEIVEEEWGQYLDDVQMGEAPLWYSGWISEGADPAGLINFYHSGSSWNWYAGQYHNEEFNEKFDQAKQTIDREERLQLYKDCQKILVNEDMGTYITYTDQASLAHNENVRIPETSYNPFMGVGPLTVVHNWYFEAD